MNIYRKLRIGDCSENGQVSIIDEDRLCYLVKSVSKGATGIRTISKALLKEFVTYIEQHPEVPVNEVRFKISGQSDIDKYEYGYGATLGCLAKMVFGLEGVVNRIPNNNQIKNLPLQQIFYGAPGTGKSNTIKGQTAIAEEEGRVIRTTFHPDSDYSTFVGAYKPTTIAVPMRDVTGKVIYEKDKPVTENRIVYEFVPQAFLKAYTGAWKNQDEPFFLIIEEINRGNCAQIFGDLFQLLDRNDETGLSDYPISPDEDIQKFLLTDKKYGFAELAEAQKAAIPKDIRSGELLKLPKNLHIWATMNTSDQSLFPIDSAFKRRWDWRYMPISDGKKGWLIEANGKRYDWWQFLLKVNEKIGSATNSEDKKLGYFFCKAKDGIIDAETFVSKVVFYIWNDVFKDFAEDAGDLFKDMDDTLLSFNKFYTVGDDGKTKVVEEKVERLLQNLGVESIEYDAEDDEANDDSTSDNNGLWVRYEGKMVEGSSAIQVFINTIKEIGVERVANLGFKLSKGKLDLLSKTRISEDTPGGYGKPSNIEKIGEYYIIKKFSNNSKIGFLTQMKNQLSLNLDFGINN